MFIKRLNSVQREAATFGDGPLLILAGAGSGKTSVLTARIAHLITDKNVRPDEILAVTFTNKAAGEMRDRLESYIGPESRGLWLGTFHSIGLRLLRTESRAAGIDGELTVYGDDDQLALVKEVMRELSISDKSTAPRTMLWRINQAKNEFIGPSEYMEHASDFLAERTAKIYSLYQTRLRDMSCRDFGDLICDPVKMLRTNDQVREKYARRLRYILVDEYQDTNRAQYLFTQLLASGTRNVFVVGDPDQSIYAWRGADITNILEFEKDYPDATVLKLEQNYRSTKTILAAANFVIERNSQRLKKELWTENDEGELIVYEEARDERDEARRVIRGISGGVRSGGAYGESAVFYRTNAQSRVFEEELIREGIPYTVVGGVRFYDRKEIRDAIAYIRLAANPDDSISLKRVVNTPPRGVGKATLDRVVELAAETGTSLYRAFIEADARGLVTKPKVRAFFRAYEEFRDGLGSVPIADLALKLLEDSGYMMMWQEEGTEEAFGRMENLFEFVSAIKDFETANPGCTLTEFLDHIALISDIDSMEDNVDKLTLMTIHSAKGLEFDSVYIVGMEEGLFPHSRSIDDPDQLEEERRLCYVGMTRARKRLALYSAITRSVYGETRYQMRSRFVDEIPADQMRWLAPERTIHEDKSGGVFTDDEPYYTSDGSQLDDNSYGSGSSAADCGLRVGMKVAHPSFGVGVIKDRTGVGEDTKVTVRFKTVGEKKLALKYAVLEPVF